MEDVGGREGGVLEEMAVVAREERLGIESWANLISVHTDGMVS